MKLCFLGALFLVCMGLMPEIAEPRPLAPYNENIHLTLTQLLAEAVGITTNAAVAIARADQDTDDDTETNPLLTVEARENYHFVSPGRLEALRMQARESCDFKMTGQYLHALEDSYSHRGYSAVLGHVFDARPDQAWRDPKKALEMASDKFNRLAQLKAACKSFSNGSRNAPKSWRQIEQQVRGLISAH
jgi:hypothetical protein